jgi:hypothetical protein
MALYGDFFAVLDKEFVFIKILFTVIVDIKIRHPRQQGVVFAPLLIFFGGGDV